MEQKLATIGKIFILAGAWGSTLAIWTAIEPAMKLLAVFLAIIASGFTIVSGYYSVKRSKGEIARQGKEDR